MPWPAGTGWTRPSPPSWVWTSAASRLPSSAEVSALVRSRLATTLPAGVELVTPDVGWDDIVLPAEGIAQLSDAVARLDHQRLVLDYWDLRRRAHAHARRPAAADRPARHRQVAGRPRRGHRRRHRPAGGRRLPDRVEVAGRDREEPRRRLRGRRADPGGADAGRGGRPVRHAAPRSPTPTTATPTWRPRTCWPGWTASRAWPS